MSFYPYALANSVNANTFSKVTGGSLRVQDNGAILQAFAPDTTVPVFEVNADTKTASINGVVIVAGGGGDFKSDGTVAMTGNLNMGSQNIIALGYTQFADIAAPTNPGAGLGRLYKKTGDDGLFWKPDAAGPEIDLSAAGVGDFKADGTVAMTGDLNMATNNIINVGETEGLGLDVGQLSTRTKFSMGVEWNSETAGISHGWDEIAWSSTANGTGLFVAVGSTGPTGNRVSYSSDGLTWTAATTTADNWKGVEWAPAIGLFVAVGDGAGVGDGVISSPDGITWTDRTPSETNSWVRVAWSPALTLFAAVSSNGVNRVMTSPDGITWTARAASEANSWRGIVWSPSLALFAAISTDGTNRVMTSPDGITWTARAASEANSWTGITWSEELGLFVAVSTDGTNRIMTSTDGITWTARAAPEANSWTSVKWGQVVPLFVAVASDGNSRVMTSKDGITWRSAIPPTENKWQSIGWSPELGKFVIGSAGSTTSFLISTMSVLTDGISELTAGAGVTINDNLDMKGNTVDLVGTATGVGLNIEQIRNQPAIDTKLSTTWSSQTITTDTWFDIAWSPTANGTGLFAACASTIATSPDGITWTTRFTPAADLYTIIWCPDLNVFVAGGNAAPATSPDGITWTTHDFTLLLGQSMTGLVWSPQLSIMVGVATQAGGPHIAVSRDGVRWTEYTAPEDNNWQDVTWSPELGLFAAVSFGVGTNRAMTSPDGVNWTVRAAPAPNDSSWSGIDWSPSLGLFAAVAIGGTNRIMTSSDGITWTARTAPEANEWRAVKWSPNLKVFVAVSSTGTNRIMTSTDGITWTAVAAAAANAWQRLTWSPELLKFMAVANTGANRAMSSTIVTATDEILEYTAAAGVTVDSMLIKDGGVTRTGGERISMTVQAGATHTLLLTDHMVEYSFAGTVTVTLPDTSTEAGASGREFVLIKTSSTASGNVDINRSGTDVIDAAATTTQLANQYDRVTLKSNGAGRWYTF